MLRDVDSVAKLQALADAVQNVMDGDASKQDLERLGITVTGVTDDKVKAIRDALAAKPDADLDSLSELQAVVDDAIAKFDAALDKIADYAETGTVLPAVQDYADIGVSGVNAGNLAAINSAIN